MPTIPMQHGIQIQHRSPPKRVGIFGGTFDPIHIGHLVTAVEARYQYDLDTVYLVVANIPWQKAGSRQISGARSRLAVVEAAVSGLEGMEASAVEIDRGGPSYTSETVAEIRRSAGADEIWLIVGADAAATLDTWHDRDHLKEQVNLLVVNRGGAGSVQVPPGWRPFDLQIPSLEISSTDLRNRLKDGRPVDFLIPCAAVEAIRRLGMYACPG